jgi:hypothetical protein
MATAGVQLSVAVAKPRAAGLLLSVQAIVTFDGHRIVGAWLSRIVIVKEQVLVLLDASVAI